MQGFGTPGTSILLRLPRFAISYIGSHSRAFKYQGAVWHSALSTAMCYFVILVYCIFFFLFSDPNLPPPPRFSPACLALQEIVPIMDLAVNEEFTRMYSEEELMGARRIQARMRLPLPVVSWFSVLLRCC